MLFPAHFRLKSEVAAVSWCKVAFPWLSQNAAAVQRLWYGTMAAVEVYTKLDVTLLMNAHFHHLPEPLAADHRDISPICSDAQDLQRAFPATILTYRLTLMNGPICSFPESRHRLLRLHHTHSFQKKRSQLSNLCY